MSGWAESGGGAALEGQDVCAGRLVGEGKREAPRSLGLMYGIPLILYDLFPQELAANNSGVPAYSYIPYASPRDRLIHELSRFRQEYFAMLYGGLVSAW